MRILHMIWLPFAYWFSPYKLANNELRGTLKKYGVNLAVIPTSLSEEISRKIIDSQKLSNQSSSIFKKLYDLQLLVDFNAITMKKIINHEFKFEYEFTPEVEHIKNIMLKHAIRR